MYRERERYNEQLVKTVYEGLWESLVTCDGSYPLSQVELSFRWDSNSGETIMQRFTKFHNKEEFLAACVKSKPHTIQLGGILPNFPPPPLAIGEIPIDPARSSIERDRELCKANITCARGPLVIDIDLTDYDRSLVCFCLKEKKCCNVCFSVFMKPAMEILQYILCDLFEFKKVFFVWSGGRGIHTWVVDDCVINWTDYQRTTFIYRISKMEDDPMIQEILERIPPIEGSTETIYKTFYPKFDFNVSKSAAHLKKLPLAIHQITGNICFPLLKPNLFQPEMHSKKPNDISIDTIKKFCTGIKEKIK